MSKTLLTLLAGIAIGLLVAPGKGSEVLRNLVDELKAFRNKFVNKQQDLMEW